MHTERGAVMFCGRSGVGKSTILGAMMREGHRMIVDDVCAIDNSPDGPLVLPGYARTRVWADSARELEVDTTHLTRTRDSIEKFERQVEDFWPDALPARALYHLTSSNRRDIEITPLSAVDAFQTVVTQTYRARLVGGLETQREHFAQASAFAASVPVRRIERPEGSFALDELVAAVSFDLESLA